MENKVLVTGSDGFIGSHVSRAFFKADWYVCGLDNKQVSANARSFNQEFLRADYGDIKVISKYLEQVRPRVIVHCAGTSLVGPSMMNPSEYYQNNVRKTIDLFDTVLDVMEGDLPTILFSSSASVYGNAETYPITETDTLDPMSPYGRSKLIIENLLKDYHHAYGLKSVCFRYFNAAGATPEDGLGQPMDATHILARIISAKIKGNWFTLYGNDYNTDDGTCIRDYVHVRDIADAHVKAVVNHSVTEAEVFNLGTNTGFSNQEIIDHVDSTYNGLDYEVGERRAGDPDRLIADCSRARSVLNWEPEDSSLEQIVKDVWNWYSELSSNKEI